MSVRVRFRDLISRLVPPWLSDRPGKVAGKTVGYRVLWGIIAPLDVLGEMAMQALQAPWPGLGTTTALPFIGRTRGILRGQGESDDDYSARLRKWLDTWRGTLLAGGGAGSQLAVAVAFHAYLANHPRVRVVNRAGHCTTVAADGTVTVTEYDSWDWDSVSHPARSTHWWDQWVIVYPSQWADAGLLDDGGLIGGDDFGLGHLCDRVEVDALLGELRQWASAHTFIRAVIWTADGAQFDPSDAGTCPDGKWGAWSVNVDDGLGHGTFERVQSNRDTSCRFWEPRQ